MTSSAASFRSFMVYPALIEKGYLPVQEENKDDPVNVLPPLRVKYLERIETPTSPRCSGTELTKHGDPPAS
ncbi:unnamed protein product [Urochloa humidicola]